VRYGNDDPDVDTLAADVARFVFGEFLQRKAWRGGKFLPSCIMFETYGHEGERVSATPDGRRAGEPIADSIGPHQGRDTNGPTAMLRSVTRLPLDLAVGTPVVNIRFSKAMFATAEHRQRVRELVQTYFKMGGMQLQVSVVDQEVLRDAIARPERHEDLIVRIGGYSTYFNRLSPELKQAVLERSVHGN
jgi:formate C-acetyltransferase